MMGKPGSRKWMYFDDVGALDGDLGCTADATLVGRAPRIFELQVVFELSICSYKQEETTAHRPVFHHKCHLDTFPDEDLSSICASLCRIGGCLSHYGSCCSPRRNSSTRVSALRAEAMASLPSILSWMLPLRQLSNTAGLM